MLKGEIEILTNIALNKCKMRQIIEGRIARDNLYIMVTVESMVKNGFIQESKSKEYHLTLKGVRALLEFGNNREISRKILHSQLFSQYSEKSIL